MLRTLVYAAGLPMLAIAVIGLTASLVSM